MENTHDNANNTPKDLAYFTYEEVARILKVKRGTVRLWVYRGKIRQTVRMGKRTLIPRAELERFVNERTHINKKKAFEKNDNLPKNLKSKS